MGNFSNFAKFSPLTSIYTEKNWGENRNIQEFSPIMLISVTTQSVMTDMRIRAFYFLI